VRFPKAYEAKHLRVQVPAKHLKAPGPAKHLKSPDVSKTPAWATVIAGTGVAATLVGATNGQFQGTTVKPNNSTLRQKSANIRGEPANSSAVRQLLNASIS
jgi:hypothetical protein